MTATTPNAGSTPAHISKLNTANSTDNVSVENMPPHIRALRGESSSEIEANPSVVKTEETTDETPVEDGDEGTEETEDTVIKEEPKVKKAPKVKKEVETPKPQIVKLKFDGKEEDFDASNHKEVQKWVQLGKVSAKKFDEASALHNEARGIVQTVNNDPIAALKQLGWNDGKLDEYFTNFVHSRIMHNNMSAKEKELYDREQKLVSAEKQRQYAEQQKQTAETTQKFVKTGEEIQQDLMRAFDSRKDIPKNETNVVRALYYIRLNAERGIDVTAADVLDQVKDDLGGEQKHLLKDMTDEQLLNWLGDDLIKKFNKAVVGKVKKDSVKIQQNPATKKKPTQQTERFNDSSEFFDFIKEKKMPPRR